MSNMEGMDIRAPIGGLFTVLGVMLAGYGLVAPAGGGLAGSPSTTNVNLWWGLTMLVFGVIMRKVIRRGSFTSTADLKDKLTRFIAYFNEVFAKPFRWTFTGRPLQTGEQKKTSKRRQRFQRINDLRY